MKIVVLDGQALNPTPGGDLDWNAVEQSGTLEIFPRTPPELVLERLRGAQVVITNKVPFDAARLAQLPELKLIAVTATGYNIIDTEAAKKQGVTVSNVPAYSTDSVAQHVFALILELTLQVGLHDRAVHAGEWLTSDDFCFRKAPLIELAGKTLGLIGFGQIGRQTGQIAHAFGMKVLAYSRTRSQTAQYPFQWAEPEEIFRLADFVSLHVPQTPQTTAMVNHRTLGLMKPTAFLINTARGGLVNEADLAAALNAETIRGAGLDVLAAEPMHKDNPLLTAKNCIITPHMAWATHEARARCMQITAANIAAFAAGKPQNVVNP